MNSTYIQEVLLKINSADSEQTVKRLEQTIKNCAAEKDKLIKAKPDQKDWTEQEWKNWQKWTKEMASAERQLKRYGTTSTFVKETLDNLSGKSLKDLNAALKTMQKALDGGQIARGSKAWNELTEAIRNTKEEIERIKGETKVVEQAMVDCAQKPKNSLSELGKAWGGFAAMVTAGLNIYDRFMGKASEYVNKYAELQEHVSGVIKYTGMGAEAAAELNEEFKKMDTRTSRAALNDLAADAGRLGLKGKKDVLDFVQAADQINIALGEDLGEGAVKSIGNLANIFGDDQRLGLKQAMLSTASAVQVHINASFLDIFGCARHNPGKLGFCSRLAQTLVQLYHGEKTSVVNEHCVKQNKRNVRVRIMSESRKETVKQESCPRLGRVEGSILITS